MEDPNEKIDSNKQDSKKLFEKSAELKKKNTEVLEKLRSLKEQTDELLKPGESVPKT